MPRSTFGSANELLAQTQTRLIEKLQSSEQRYADLVGNLQDVVFHLDQDLRCTFLNKAWQEISGYPVEESLGCPLLRFLVKADKDDGELNLKRLLEGKESELRQQLNLYCSDGSQKEVEISCRPIKDATGQLSSIAGILSDISERVEQQRQIYFMAYHDALTGLANRRYLMQLLETRCQQKSTGPSAIFYIDLDGFKQVNDLHGHPIGDRLLQTTADLLLQLCKTEQDCAARVGGDEFILLLDLDSSYKQQDNLSSRPIAESIREKITAITQIDNSALNPSCSIGVVEIKPGRLKVEELLKQADFAMYQAKSSGKNQIRIYDKALARLGQKKIQLESELRRALHQQEFKVFYQPQLEAISGRCNQAEALLRWQHPERGLLSPQLFIPALESTGLIIQVGDWLIQESLAQLSSWHRRGLRDFRLAINVSPNQFKNLSFVNNIRQGLQQHQLRGQHLELEITESIAIDDMAGAVKKMEQIRDLGIAIALDDFGTGYSSLSYLKQLPINTIKLDRSFIQDLSGGSYDLAIVKSTLVMAKHLGLTVIAEGVETEEQLRYLQKLGCPSYQGFLSAAPLTTKDLFTYAIENLQQYRYSEMP